RRPPRCAWRVAFACSCTSTCRHAASLTSFAGCAQSGCHRDGRRARLTVALIHRIERREIRRNIDDVVVSETGDRLFHQRRVATVPPAILEHVELARDVCWMTACEPRHVAESLQLVAVANRALNRFAAARFHERFALLDAADRDVRDKSRMWIAVGGSRWIRRTGTDACIDTIV